MERGARSLDRDAKSRNALSKSGSYENIEQLSADLIAVGNQVRDESLTTAKSRDEYASTKKSTRGRSPAASPHLWQKVAKKVSDDKEYGLSSFLACSHCESDNLVSQAALPPSHSKWLFAVSWLSVATALLSAHCELWDLLIVPLGVSINSLNYWRKPDYGWRRYLDIVFIQFAIPYSCYKAYECAEPYRGIYYACLTTGIALFANACRLCSCRPTDGRWSDFFKEHPAEARRLAWSTGNHFMLHVMCNAGNVALFVGLRATRLHT